MAATNYTPIQLYFSTTASAVPLAANLAQGELAINITDGKLYYEDNGGVVQVIATKGAGTIGGSTTQIQYNNAGALAGNAAMTFNSGTSTTTLTTLNLTNALGATYGGTAQSAYTQGDVLYASATNTLSKLGIGTVNYILTSTGTVPQWVAPTSITVNTATNLAGGAAGSVPYQSGVATTTFLAIGAANRVMTSSGTAPQWVTALTGLTGVSSSSITNTSLTSGRVIIASTAGLEADSANLTFDGTTLSSTGYSTTGLSTLVKTVKIGDSSFNGVAVFAAATPAKLYMGTGTVTDVTSAISATNAIGAIASLGITPIAATNTSVTYTNAATLYIAGAPSAGTNVTLTNPYSLYVAGGAAYFGGAVTVAGSLSLAAVTVTSLTDSGLTSGRVTFASTGGLLADSANLTFNGTILTSAGFSGPLNGTVGATTASTGAFSSGSFNSANGSIVGNRDALVVDYSAGNSRVFASRNGVASGNLELWATDSGGAAAKITTVSSTGLAVTGTLSATGAMTSTYTSTYFLSSTSAGTGPSAANIYNTSGNLILGVEGSAGGALVTGSTAYATILASYANKPIQFGVNDTVRATISSTTLALGVGISLTGGTSGTGYSFSGSAPATSLTLDSSGNLGVGAASSGNKLEVTKSQNASTRVQIDNQNSGASALAGISLSAYGGNWTIDVPASTTFVNPLKFNFGATTMMTLDSTGRLGIGQTNPISFIDVYGNGSYTYARFYRSDEAGYGGRVGNGNTLLGSAGTRSLGLDGFSSINFGIAGTQVGLIDSSGNLGLGVTPSAWNSSWAAFQLGNRSLARSNAGAGDLTMVFNGYFDATDSRWEFQNSGDYAARYSITGAGIHSWHTSTAAGGAADAPISFTQAMTLDASGYLLVGATSSVGVGANRFQVGSSGGQAQILAKTSTGHASIYATGTDVYQTYVSGGFLAFGEAPSNGSTFTERARIDSSGNLLVGTTTANSGVSLFPGFSSAGSSGIDIKHVSTAATGEYYITFQYNSGLIGSITQNGTTGVLYNLTSDYRLKNNPEALTGAKEFVMALQPKKWQWWDGSGEGVGFVAHEFMEVAKYSGHGTKDAVDTDGKPVMQSIQPSSSEVMANLVSLIQEQQALITQLTARITALETP
jgi:hypothetical protein